MQVTNLGEKLIDWTEGAIRIHLLKVCLRESTRVLFVVIIGAIDDESAAMPHEFSRNDGPTLIVLRKFDSIVPWSPFKRYDDINNYIGIPTCVERTDLGDALSCIHGALESALCIRHIAQKAKSVEKIRLASGVWTNNKGTPLEGDVGAEKVSPVFQLHSCKVQAASFMVAATHRRSPKLLGLTSTTIEHLPRKSL